MSHEIARTVGVFLLIEFYSNSNRLALSIRMTVAGLIIERQFSRWGVFFFFSAIEGVRHREQTKQKATVTELKHNYMEVLCF